jgi:chromosome segregation ATPase
MIIKSLKVLAAGVLGLAVAAGGVALVFGKEARSYLRSSAYGVRDMVKDNVPIEFELRRARDLVNDIVPEMHANIRLIAQQEVEVSRLREEIAAAKKSLTEEQARVQKLRGMLDTREVSFRVNSLTYERQELKDELARRFDRYKEAEMVLASKEKLLVSREKALKAGMQMLERTRGQKQQLEQQIAALESQFRLVQAASHGSKLDIDHSKLAQTQKLIDQIRKQLDISERVLAHEAKFTETSIPVDAVNEKELVESIDEHFNGTAEGEQTVAAPHHRN